MTEEPPDADPQPLIGMHSKVIRHEAAFTWRGVPIAPYKRASAAWKGVTRRELCGRRGESTGFHVRYFEIAPGGFSSFERHDHVHVVIPIRGRGIARIGPCIHEVGFGDVVYVAPGDPHQFRAPDTATEPFGFLCIVNAERDLPEPVDDTEPGRICE